MLTYLISLLTLSFIGGVLYRLRGGHINEIVGGPIGTQNARLIYAIPTALFAGLLAGLPWFMFPVLAGVLWLGLVFGHAKWMMFGPQPQQTLGMSAVCALRGALAASVVVYWSPLVAGALIVGGALAGPVYYLGWRLNIKFPFTKNPSDYKISWCEFLTGFVAWGVLASIWF